MLASRNRPNKKWTDEEIERLLTGLMKFGLSSWTDIAHRWRFEDRTTVDLKDKWRNLVRAPPPLFPCPALLGRLQMIPQGPASWRKRSLMRWLVLVAAIY